MSSRIELPVDIKLTIGNQNETMKKVVAEFQEAFSHVDPYSSLGRGFNKTFNDVQRKIGKINALLGKDIFDEKDLKMASDLMNSISNDISGMTVRGQGLNARALGLETEQLEIYEERVRSLKKELSQARGRSVGSVLGADNKELQQFQAAAKDTGFDAGKSYSANINALTTSLGNANAELTTMREKAEAARKVLTDLRTSENEGLLTQQAGEAKIAARKQDYAEVEKLLEGAGRKRNAEDALKSYSDLIRSQLASEAGKESPFISVISSWLKLTPEQLSQPAAELANTLNQAIAKSAEETGKYNVLHNALTKVNKGDYSADAKMLAAQAQVEQGKQMVQQAQSLVPGAEIEVKNAESNLQKATELINTINTQLQQLRQLRAEYEAAVGKQYSDKIAKAQADVDAENDRIVAPLRRNLREQNTEAGGAAEKVKREQNKHTEEVIAAKEAERFESQLQQSLARWMSTRDIINYIKQGIRSAYQDIQGLDKAMTNIAVVTDMSVSDLWGKINDYMAIAKEYGVTTQGVYEVSQLYYQQGLGTQDVMAATTETLKLARIAGMEYAEAADAMTVAIRSFKMEMSDAATVTDVYSKVAAVTASDSEELAIAMSKTASSAESVGSSFENTTAMLAVMIETTRESA